MNFQTPGPRLEGLTVSSILPKLWSDRTHGRMSHLAVQIKRLATRERSILKLACVWSLLDQVKTILRGLFLRQMPSSEKSSRRDQRSFWSDVGMVEQFSLSKALSTQFKSPPITRSPWASINYALGEKIIVQM